MGNQYEAFSFSDWWSALSPSFVSLCFILFVFLLVGIYYIFPKKCRWAVLLVGSAAFYLTAGIGSLLTVAASSIPVYFSALLIENTDKKQKGKRRVWLALGAAGLLAALVFSKCYSLFQWQFNYVIPLGISYYTFSAIGYLADVYWNKDRAERNPFRLMLFLLFFPKILQGPIAKHKSLAPQLNAGNAFDYKNFCFGIQLALWGYFKKMVVADRISIITSAVFDSPEYYGGTILFCGMLGSAVQLYCDFSGCMDIAGGVSQMFGITLEKNFNHPFFAKSGAEFWQRWHITLSGWFRDYLFLPVSRTEWVKKLSKKVGERFGAKARKNTIILVASFFVWIATGLWHGTGIPYLAWGLYWYIIISSSTLLGDFYKKITDALHINTEGFVWRVFQMLRTFVIFAIGRLITIPGDLGTSFDIFTRFFSDARIYELFTGRVFSLGLSQVDYGIMLIGIGTVFAAEVLQTKYSLREQIAKWVLPARCVFYAASVMVVLIFGMYGADLGNVTFLYMNY